jgi:hypothetical protein
LPFAASAQSAIVGTVKDATDAVLPGVDVEASSPALIEKVRVTTTDAQGQYRIVNLRPGTYSVSFTLPGFTTVKRDEILLEADFTATVNAELRVATVEETLRVSAESPVVDVQTTSKREVLDQELLDSLPTGRDFQGIGATLPAISMGRFDVGGSQALIQGSLVAYGGLGGDTAIEIDGQNVMSVQSQGNITAVYYQNGNIQEMVYQVAGGSAESQTGGVLVNMIPKEGGNQFHGSMAGLYSRTGLQGNNITDALKARGYKSPGSLARLWDVNPDIGGPLKRDRVWFYYSYRNWTYDTYVGNVSYPDGRPAIDDSVFQAHSPRLTFRPSATDKFTVAQDFLPRTRYHFNIISGLQTPAGSPELTHNWPFVTQAKWTRTLGSKLLLEAGGIYMHYDWAYGYQPDLPRATCFTAFNACPPTTNYGAISHVNLFTGIRDVAASAITAYPPDWNRSPKHNIMAAVSYVTGKHALKVGIRQQWGEIVSSLAANGDLYQNYRNGVPDSVDILNTPNLSDNKLDDDLGVFIQDSWRATGRLTLNPGLRFEYLRESTAAVDTPAGRFVPARHFDAIDNLPNWKDVAPRFGAAYDLFGNGKTAFKGSIGKYMEQDSVGFASRYNPSVSATDRRTWADLNGDGIAEENEIGPSQNSTFGVRRNRNPDPNIKRPYQVTYNLGLQHELSAGLSVSANYYRREYHRIIWTQNLSIPASNFATEYNPVVIPDPRGTGQTITVYNLNRQFLGLVNELDTNSANDSRTYNGVDLTFNARLKGGGSLIGGLSTGKVHQILCDVEDPNQLRGCNADFGFQTQLKLSGTYPLPYGVHISAVFQSMPGILESRFNSTDPDINVTYLVNRTVIPTLTQSNVAVRLNTPGTEFADRNNQLDLSLAKEFRIGSLRAKPQLDIFNLLNVSPVTNLVTTWGPSLYQPLTILPARLLRLGLRLDF